MAKFVFLIKAANQPLLFFSRLRYAIDNMPKRNFSFQANMWLYPGASAAWHFITVPKKQSEEIKKQFGKVRRGWGSVRVRVTIGKTSWDTSIFPDSKIGAYILPVKAEVRNKERISAGSKVKVKLVVG